MGEGTELELCCMTVRQASFPELIDVASTNGFGVVTTTPWLYEAAGLSDDQLRARLDRHGVRVGYVDGLITALPGATPRPGAATEDECYRIAEALGAPAVNVVHIGGRPTPLGQLAEALDGVCRRADERGLRIVVEFVPETGITDLPTALQLVEMVGAANLGIVLDTWHLARSGGKTDDVARAASRVRALQVSDRRRAQDLEPYVPMSGRHLPGEGELPLVDMIDAVRRQHPEVPVGIEVINDELRAMPAAEAANRAAASLRRLVDPPG
jgi:sugar phosphate isomerase/epimerase